LKQRTTILIAILAAVCSAPLAAQSYTFESIECNNLPIFAYGMNGSGLVVGTAGDSGVIYSNGKCQTYPSVFFYGVTDTNWLIGGVKGGNAYELIEPGLKVTPLPAYPGAHGTSYCCMDTMTGTLAGNYYPYADGGALVGFTYQNGKFTSLPWNEASGTPSYWFTLTALNNTGTAVGNFEGNYQQGFVYQKGTITYLEHPGSEFTYFQGLNDSEVIVASYSSDDGPSGISLYNIQTATWTDLNFPYPYNDMMPVGISNTGVIALGGPYDGLVLATPSSN
jgi:hypothetical protein